MAVSVISGSGSTLLQVDPTNLAARVSVRPLEVVGATSGGFFRVALKSGVIASAVASSPLWSFRWSTAFNIELHRLLREVELGYHNRLRFSAAYRLRFVLRSFILCFRYRRNSITAFR